MSNTAKAKLESRENQRYADAVAETKLFRVELDRVLQAVKNPATGRTSLERSHSIKKIQEAIMWLGMDLKALGTETPYPHSYDPCSPIVEPTADGLQL
jgi:hypothetical protein